MSIERAVVLCILVLLAIGVLYFIFNLAGAA